MGVQIGRSNKVEQMAERCTLDQRHLGPNHEDGIDSHLCAMIGFGYLTNTTQLEVVIVVEWIVIYSGTCNTCSSFHMEVHGRGGCISKSATT